MTSEQTHRGPSGLIWTATALIAAAAVVPIAAPEFTVVAGRVVTSTGVGGVLVLGGGAIVTAHWLRRRSRKVSAQRAALSAGSWICIVTTSIALTVFGFVGGLQALFGQYYVLGPTGSDGCWGVVRESAGWPGAAGRVYAVRGFGTLHQVAYYSGDDGYGPMANGTYDFTAVDGVGALTVHGIPNMEVYPEGPFLIECVH